jgi:hypothetical protein
MIQIKRQLNAAISATDFHREERKAMLQQLATVDANQSDDVTAKLIDDIGTQHKQWCEQKRKDQRIQ